MTIVDSSVWIDYFNGVTSNETELLDRKLATERIGIGDIILSEVRVDLKMKKALKKRRTIYRHCPVSICAERQSL